jgi:hypothetical protein
MLNLTVRAVNTTSKGFNYAYESFELCFENKTKGKIKCPE